MVILSYSNHAAQPSLNSFPMDTKFYFKPEIAYVICAFCSNLIDSFGVYSVPLTDRDKSYAMVGSVILILTFHPCCNLKDLNIFFGKKSLKFQ